MGNSKPKGYCVACGEYARLSKEHFWPKWLRKRMGNPMFTFTFEAVGHEPKVKVGNLGLLNVRKPCKACNEGWMRDLQNRAGPLVDEMVNGRRVYLDEDAQRILSAWGAMTAYMYAERSPTGSGVSREHYDWLRVNAVPHPNARVRTSCYQGGDEPGWFHAQYLAFEGSGISVPPPNGYWISLCIEHLVLQVLGYCGPEAFTFRLDVAPLGVAYHIHPFVHVRTWPPLDIVKTGHLKKLAAFPAGSISENLRPNP